MDKYEQLVVVGEGSYGIVMKCRHKETNQVVAIKKFLETEEDATVRKMALREIRMLKKLRHENLVTMIEVFRHRKRFYIVFEYLEGTILDEIEKMPNGLGEERTKERLYQLIRALHYIHSNHVIHRDVKPENVLVSTNGIVKLCDFGFARLVSTNGEQCTEYVATRWYRAPELLVGDLNYGPPVDIWGVGCLFYEIMTGDPLFPGESDIDQLYLILKTIGKPCQKHEQMMQRNANLRGLINTPQTKLGFFKSLPNWSLLAINFLIFCLRMDPVTRPPAEELLKHNFFTHDKFPKRFLPCLREKVLLEFNSNPLLRRFKTDVIMSTDKELKRFSVSNQKKWKIQIQDNCIERKLSKESQAGNDKSKLNEAQWVYACMKNDVLPVVDLSLHDVKQTEDILEMMPKECESVCGSLTSNSNELTTKSNINNNVTGKTTQCRIVNEKGAKKSTNKKSTKQFVPHAPHLTPAQKRSEYLVKRMNTKQGDQTYVCDVSSASWLSTLPPYHPYGKRRDTKVKSEIFSLPVVPGATESPKKQAQSTHTLDAVTGEISPGTRYAKTKRKHEPDSTRLPSLRNMKTVIQ